jgi:WD40 repeat protein
VATDAGASAIIVDPGMAGFPASTPIAITGGLDEVDVKPAGDLVYGVSQSTRMLHRIDATPGAIGWLDGVSIDGEPIGLLIEPSGKRAFIPTLEGQIQIWDVSEPTSPTFEQQIGVIEPSDANIRGKLATDPAGDFLLALTGTGNLLVYDLGPDTLEAEIKIPLGERVYVSHDTRLVSVVSLTELYHVQDIATGGTLRGLAVSPTGAFLEVVNREFNLLQVIDLRDGSRTFRNIVASIPQPVNPVDVELSPTGLYAYTISESEQELAVNTIGFGPTLDALSRIAGPVGTQLVLSGLDLAQSETKVSFNGLAVVPDQLEDASLVVTVPSGATSGPVTVVGTNQDGLTTASNAIFFEVLGPTPPGGIRLAGEAQPAGAPALNPAMAMSPTGDMALVGDGSGVLHFLDTDVGSPTFNQFFDQTNAGANVDDIVITPDGKRAFILSEGGDAIPVIDIDRHSTTWGTAAGTVNFPSPGISKGVMSPDGRTLLVSDEATTQLRLVDTQTFAYSIITLSGEGGTNGVVREMAFHPAGRYAYLPVHDPSLATILVFDVVTESVVGMIQPVVPLVNDEIPVSASFTPDGSRCLVLTTQTVSPANRTLVMLDTSDPVNPVFSQSFPITTTIPPANEHVHVSPAGDRAIVNIRDTGFHHFEIQTNPDALVLLEVAGDVAHHQAEVDFDYAADGSSFYSVSPAVGSVFVQDFTQAQELSLVSGDGQTGVADQTLPSPIRVQAAVSGTGEPVSGVAVTFEVLAGGGVFVGSGTSTQVVVTDRHGLAEVKWVLGADIGIGTHQVEATAPELIGSPISIVADATDDPNTVDLYVSDVIPPDGTQDVSITTATLVTFSRAINTETVGPATLFLHTGDLVPPVHDRDHGGGPG